MSKRTMSPRIYVEDMLQYCDHILTFTSGMTSEDFHADLRTQFAVTRAIEILGEAAKRVLDALPENDPRLQTLPLQKAYATRNRLIHGYEPVLVSTLWEITQQDVPGLRVELLALLASWPDTKLEKA